MKFTNYAYHVNAPQYVIDWVEKVMTDEIDTTEGEHVIDYLVSDEAPKRLENANYKETKASADKWLKTQIKKGNDIKETPEDTEVILDFEDGFKIVKLVGENAYKREGYLMSHCCASYFGRDVEVYSLRDNDNMPHATIEKNQQIKGKGNGDIDIKYVDYIVRFLESINMQVSDSEMKHLGYVNISEIQKEDENAIFDRALIYRDVYYPKNKVSEIKDKNGNRYESLTLWGVFDLFELSTRMEVKFNFSIENSVKTFQSFFKSPNKNYQVGGDFARMAGGYYARMAGGDFARMAGGYSARMVGGDSARMAGGDYAHMAGGYSAHMAGGDSARMELKGKHAISISGKNSKVRGVIGSGFAIGEYDEDYNLIKLHAVVVDGEKIKADTWYCVKNGELVEADNEN